MSRGIEVTLFATADSLTTAKLVGSAPSGYSEDAALNLKVWEALHSSAVFERAAEFDLIHNSFDFLPLVFSRLVETALLTTIHGFSSESIVHGRRASRPSDRARRHRPGPRLLRAAVAPRMDGDQVSYIGAVGAGASQESPRRRRGDSSTSLDLDEPFGLSVVEAMACGTPVIATARGSMPEIVRHGENGFLVTSAAEAVAALALRGTLDRRAVLASVAERFRAEKHGGRLPRHLPSHPRAWEGGPGGFVARQNDRLIRCASALPATPLGREVRRSLDSPARGGLYPRHLGPREVHGDAAQVIAAWPLVDEPALRRGAARRGASSSRSEASRIPCAPRAAAARLG